VELAIDIDVPNQTLSRISAPLLPQAVMAWDELPYMRDELRLLWDMKVLPSAATIYD